VSQDFRSPYRHWYLIFQAGFQGLDTFLPTFRLLDIEFSIFCHPSVNTQDEESRGNLACRSLYHQIRARTLFLKIALKTLNKGCRKPRQTVLSHFPKITISKSNRSLPVTENGCLDIHIYCCKTHRNCTHFSPRTFAHQP